MRINLLISIGLAGCVLTSCSNKKANSKTDPRLIGVWTSKTGGQLEITDKKFTMKSDAPDAEDYFVKGDTIYTSFEGNLPYTEYAIKKLDEHNLELFTPDSTTVTFSR